MMEPARAQSLWRMPGRFRTSLCPLVHSDHMPQDDMFVVQLMSRAHVAQSVEHVLGKDGVAGSIPAVGLALYLSRGGS